MTEREIFENPRGIRRVAAALAATVVTLGVLLPSWTQGHDVSQGAVASASGSVDLSSHIVDPVCPAPLENQATVTVWENPHPPFRRPNL